MKSDGFLSITHQSRLSKLDLTDTLVALLLITAELNLYLRINIILCSTQTPRRDTLIPQNYFNSFLAVVQLETRRVTSGIWKCLKHDLYAWIRFRMKLLPNHRKYACLICVFGMKKKEDLAKNSKHHRFKLILLCSQVRCH